MNRLLHPIFQCLEAPLHALLLSQTKEKKLWKWTKPDEKKMVWNKLALEGEMTDAWTKEKRIQATELLVENKEEGYTTNMLWGVLKATVGVTQGIAVFHYNQDVNKWITFYSSQTNNPQDMDGEEDANMLWVLKCTDSDGLYIVKKKERLVDSIGYCPYCTGVEMTKTQSKNVPCLHRTKKELKRINKNKKRKTGVYANELGNVVDENVHIIHNEDNLCGPRAIVVAMEYLKHSAGKPNQFDRIRNDIPYQDRVVNGLLLDAGIPPGDVDRAGGMKPTHDELGTLAGACGSYIRVFAKSNKYSVIFKSHSPDRVRAENEHNAGSPFDVKSYDMQEGNQFHRPMQQAPDDATFIYLLYDGGHYDAVLMPKRLFQPNYVGKWCHWCCKSVVYGRNIHHQCQRSCQVCNDEECP
ncbi:MAG: hypothetical protein KUG67_02680, partial [Proteobacteria bacterium]|nr:hypothetical protein [Pseudomonadota bacterium]